MPIVVDIGTLIERSPDIRKGRPCIAGTGVTVRRIAGWHNLGLAPEEIAAKIEHLTLAQIHAALAYYHANRDEIDSDIAAEEEQAGVFDPSQAGYPILARTLAARRDNLKQTIAALERRLSDLPADQMT